jgi:hypothetical protein
MSYQNNKSGISCAEFDARLTDALDGVLSGRELEEFRAHVDACMDCGPVYQQASRGMELLKSLEEVEPPTNLVHNILAKTSHREQRVVATVPGQPVSWGRRVADFISPSLAPALAPVFNNVSLRNMMQPRFAMTLAMTFFSLSLIMNAAGIRMKDVKNWDLRPNAIATSASLTYHETTARVVKYYENIRFLNEWESRLKAVKSSSTEEDNKQQEKKRPADDNSSERKKQREEKDVNYSLQQGFDFLAVNFIHTPAFVPATEGR